MTEVLQDVIRDTSQQAIKERNERPAQMPNIALTEDQDEINRVIDGKADLAYSMSFEVLPKFELADFSALKLERHGDTERLFRRFLFDFDVRFRVGPFSGDRHVREIDRAAVSGRGDGRIPVERPLERSVEG